MLYSSYTCYVCKFVLLCMLYGCIRMYICCGCLFWLGVCTCSSLDLLWRGENKGEGAGVSFVRTSRWSLE